MATCCDMLASCSLTHLAAFSAKRTEPGILYDKPANRPKHTCRHKTHTLTRLAALLEHPQSQNRVCLKERGENGAKGRDKKEGAALESRSLR